MKRNLLHIASLASLLLALSACNKEPVVQGSEEGTKTPIELSVGIADTEVATKSVVTDEQGKSLVNLAGGTSLFMLMKSEYTQLSEAFSYLDYQGTQKGVKYTTTRGKVGEDNKIVFEDDASLVRTRYWDDAHGRSSRISVWALACNGLDYLGGIGTTELREDKNIFYNSDESYNTKANSTVPSNKLWQADLINARLLQWNVPHGTNGQTETTVTDRDLLFSNNLVNHSPDYRLYFDTATKKFVNDRKMIFYHALSKIVINIYKGVGFTGDTDFRFSANKNVELNCFNIWGQFNAEQGEFVSSNSSHEKVASIYNTTGAIPCLDGDKPAYVLEALVLPYYETDGKSPKGSQFTKTGTDVMMTISIDNSNYPVTSKQLFDAIKSVSENSIADDATAINMEAGKKYVFNFTVSKTKITNITAQVVDWETVTAAEVTPSNARIELNVEDRSGGTGISSVTSGIDIYRALDKASTITDGYEGYKWTTGYSTDGKATWKGNELAYNSTYSRWSTDWFWESNMHYYHFRTLSPTSQDVVEDSENGDYTEISSSSCASESAYNTMSWGAPFKKDVDASYKFSYSTTYGFDGTGAEAATPTHQIYKAIGPVKDHETNAIKVLMFHMFSGVHFTIKTTGSNESAKDKVILAKSNGDEPETVARTKVELVGYFPKGNVRLGNGYITPGGTQSTLDSKYSVSFASATENTPYVDQQYFFSAVPQSLENVKLYITTPDNNQYIVDLKDVTATSVTNYNIANPYTQVEGSSPAKYKIDRWYPGFKYNYTFKLKKSGIENITATVVDWEEVEADEGEITIK